MSFTVRWHFRSIPSSTNARSSSGRTWKQFGSTIGSVIGSEIGSDAGSDNGSDNGSANVPPCDAQKPHWSGWSIAYVWCVVALPSLALVTVTTLTFMPRVVAVGAATVVVPAADAFTSIFPVIDHALMPFHLTWIRKLNYMSPYKTNDTSVRGIFVRPCDRPVPCAHQGCGNHLHARGHTCRVISQCKPSFSRM